MITSLPVPARFSSPRFGANPLQTPLEPRTGARYIRGFAELTWADLARAGERSVRLGELVRTLGPLGVKIPNGFVITTEAYEDFLTESGLRRRIRATLRELNSHDPTQLRAASAELQHAILAAELPNVLVEQLIGAYAYLADDQPIAVVVRATILPRQEWPSGAETEESQGTVQGVGALLESCRQSFASLFSERALKARAAAGQDYPEMALSISVQRIVPTTAATSGIMFTLDTEQGGRDVIVINSATSSTESAPRRAKAVRSGRLQVSSRRRGRRMEEMTLPRPGVAAAGRVVSEVPGGKRVREVVAQPSPDRALALSNDDVLRLTGWACQIEDLYSNQHGFPMALEIDWAQDHGTGELFVVQARPERDRARPLTASRNLGGFS